MPDENKENCASAAVHTGRADKDPEALRRAPAACGADSHVHSDAPRRLLPVKMEKITLPNGARIFALPANRATARGYSGNVLLDEFAFHEKPGEIWKAVYPIITNPLKGELKLRIVSTPAGKNSKFYDLWQNGQDFARHKTDVYDAVNDGLGIEVEQLRANLDDPDAWAQEYECNFMEASDQLFPPDLVRAAEHTAATIEWPGKPHNALFCGIDIGRYRDLTVA